jgi:hypothetical protein
MPECQAKFCIVLRGQGFSTFVIPDPKKDNKRCAQWIHNLGNLKLDIKTFKYSPDKIVCEKHFEKSCFKEDMQVSFFLYIMLVNYECKLLFIVIKLMKRCSFTMFLHTEYILTEFTYVFLSKPHIFIIFCVFFFLHIYNFISLFIYEFVLYESVFIISSIFIVGKDYGIHPKKKIFKK